MQAAIFSTHVSPQTSSSCACTNTPALYRCRDCFSPPLRCASCIVVDHVHNPLHRVERWNDKFFESTSLYFLDLVVHLGHSNRQCPHIKDSSVYKMTVVHTTGIQPLSITFCNCPTSKPRFLQLLGAKLFPATVNTPETALTFAFLEDLHIHTLCSKKSVYDHHCAIQRLTNAAATHDVPDRCREITRSLRLWQILTKNRRSGQNHGIDEYLPSRRPGSLALRCFACPEVGFNIDQITLDSALKSDCHKYTLFLSLDGNFRLQRVNKRQDLDDVALNDGSAYFVRNDEYLDYTKEVQPSSDNSTCAHLRAVRLQNVIKFKNAAVSGVVCVQCARHGFYMPNGTADLEKGEAYARSDYVLMQALDDHQSQRWIMVSYDIWCQYWKNLRARVSTHFPDKLPLLDQMRGAVPKMHIKGHVEECQVRWSFNYLEHSGETCGEKIETSWAEQNQAAPSTKQQNAGHRHDSLDDHFDFWNWGKLQTLVPHLEKTYVDCKARLADREDSFIKLCATMNKNHGPETVAKWKSLDTRPKKVNQTWTSPFIAQSKAGRPPSQLKAYQDLVRQEGIATMAGQGQGGDAEFISKGLKIEAEQYVSLLPFTSSLTQISQTPCPDDPSNSDTTNARLDLHKLLKPWLVSQEKRYPKLREDKPAIDLTRPELVPLYLPSSWTVTRPPELQRLVRVESLLREGQCHDALDSLRLAIKTFNANYKFKQDNVRGQSHNTRAQLFLETLNKDKVSALDKYNLCRDALLNLGFSLDDKTLQPLTKSQLWGRNMGAPAELGDTKTDEPWFWVVGRPSGLSQEEQKDWNYEG
ncbi:hypothetical protein BDN72DRAFT_778500 [Pluteus cervinus]|uniref:Uncharacterized protein n=1 Tax=Pluteus cervinus TaxID=181527 RepID=A0ACD3A6F0_9AGAR|nr:hypothetical protein BDN72DRAFT_778500 [Pluteus cervinus]